MKSLSRFMRQRPDSAPCDLRPSVTGIISDPFKPRKQHARRLHRLELSLQTGDRNCFMLRAWLVSTITRYIDLDKSVLRK
jgi:hypothetical protein